MTRSEILEREVSLDMWSSSDEPRIVSEKTSSDLEEFVDARPYARR
jgi:hypothetical protein